MCGQCPERPRPLLGPVGTLGKHCARESDCPPFARQNRRYLTRSRGVCKACRGGVTMTYVCHRRILYETVSTLGLRPWTIDGGPAVGTERRGEAEGKQGVCSSVAPRLLVATLAQSVGESPSVRPLPPRSTRPQLRAGGEAGCLLLGCSSLAPRLLAATLAQSVGESPSVRPLPPRSTRPQLRAGGVGSRVSAPRLLLACSSVARSYARAERGGIAVRTTTSPAVYATAATGRWGSRVSAPRFLGCSSLAPRLLVATLAQSVGESPSVRPLPPRSTRPQLRAGGEAGCRDHATSNVSYALPTSILVACAEPTRHRYPNKFDSAALTAQAS